MKQWKCPDCGATEGVIEHAHTGWVETPITEITELCGVTNSTYAKTKCMGEYDVFMYECRCCGKNPLTDGSMKDEESRPFPAGIDVVETFDELLKFIAEFC